MHFVRDKAQRMLIDAIIFFFQAEDGIRDRDVTGVQTCALPIFIEPISLTNFQQFILIGIPQHIYTGLVDIQKIPFRSEERRGGKECRYRWGTES